MPKSYLDIMGEGIAKKDWNTVIKMWESITGKKIEINEPEIEEEEEEEEIVLVKTRKKTPLKKPQAKNKATTPVPTKIKRQNTFVDDMSLAKDKLQTKVEKAKFQRPDYRKPEKVVKTKCVGCGVKLFMSKAALHTSITDGPEKTDTENIRCSNCLRGR